MNEFIKMGEKYLKDCVFDGLAHSWDVEKNKYVKAYPEVTGYVLKYFFDNVNSIPYNIYEAANYLLKIQHCTGGYYSFDRKDVLYVFDTAQIARGLLSAYNYTKNVKYLMAAKKSGEFILDSQEDNGAFKPCYNCNNEAWVVRDETYKMWNGPFSGLMCKLTEALADLYNYTGDKRFQNGLDKAAEFYKNMEYIEYTHPLGYWLEGMFEANKKSEIKKVIENKIIRRIHKNGYVSYAENLPYAYVSGTMQLGIILYKMDYIEEAKKIREYGRVVQSKHLSGGLFQYADILGEQNKSVHSEINSWGTKYFCELERLLGGED